MRTNVRTPFILFFFLLFSFACTHNEIKIDKNSLKIPEIALSRYEIIKERGKLIAVTDYNSINYFVYRGEPMGYQYELLQSLADYLGVGLEIIVNHDLDKSFQMLDSGNIDIIAMDLAVTRRRAELVDFTKPLQKTRQVLVQRKPEGWRNMRTVNQMEKHLIREPLELAGKTVFIQKNTTFQRRLENLSEEIGDSIHIVQDPQRDVEELIRAVNTGEIDYTVCDEHIGLINEKYYPDIDVQTPVSFSQNIAWAIKKGNEPFVDTINIWLDAFKKKPLATYVYNKYFHNPRQVFMARSDFHSVQGGKISDYDDIIRRESAKLGWDWRLLASLIYQESRFHPEVESWVGAYGLMQLMPQTARSYGVDTNSTPAEHIAAGVNFLKWLDRQFKPIISDSAERTKFVLASYNVGIGHVYDAQRLAEKNDKNPIEWDSSVDFYLLNKSKPAYYQDDVVKYGYCRGEEPYAFVYEILERYEHYKNVIKN